MSAFTEPFELERRRLAIGVSRHEVACDVGVSQEAVRRWELGFQFPSERNLHAWRESIDTRERHRLAELLERHWLRDTNDNTTNEKEAA